MPIISVEIMKIIDQRKGCNRRCVVHFAMTSSRYNKLSIAPFSLIYYFHYLYANYRHLNYTSLLLYLIITHLIVDFIITM